MTTALITIGIIIVLIFILNLVMGNHNHVESSITINKPVKQVFDYLKFTKNADNFSTWNMMDPEMKKEYRGTDGQVGFVYVWDSIKDKGVGTGEQETIKLEENKSIEYELRFQKPMKNVANARFELTPLSNDQTKVNWSFYGPMKFPMNLFKSVFQKVLGKAQASGLENLRRVLEK